MGKERKSILDLIGNTPIIRLKNIGKEYNANIWVKLENLNPSGSIKDRLALRMIEDAEKSGDIKKGYTIIESSSGNTAIALSFVGKLKGYRIIIFLPEVVAKEKFTMLEKYGAEFRTVKVGEEYYNSSLHGSHIEVPGRVMCREMEAKEPNTWWARQFSNPSNYKAQMEVGKEILSQIGKNIDAFVASVGTGGTLFGVATVLKKEIDSIKIVAVEPSESTHVSLTKFEIIPGITGGILKNILDSNIVDKNISFFDKEAIAMSRRLAKEEGLFVGVSAGANVLAALNIAKDLGENSNIVTVIPDRGDRYITSEHYVT
jgi:cysteine synthase A